MSPRWFVVLVGAAAVLAGVILGSVAVTARGVYSPQDAFSCGSAFAPNLDAAAGRDMLSERAAWNLGISAGDQDTVTACEDAIGSRPAFAWVLLGAGAVLAAGGLVVRGGRAGRG